MKMIVKRKFLIFVIGYFFIGVINTQRDDECPSQDLILPCRCSQRGEEIQIWCSHSDLPRVLNGIKATSRSVIKIIDELILESNLLPSLPGRAFSPLRILRLMLRHNGLERLSNGWLSDLDDSLVEIFIVERELRSVPIDSLNGLKRLEAVTIQSEALKHLPDFSGLPRLRYINIQSPGLVELIPMGFDSLKNLETIHITGSPKLSRLEAGLLHDLPKLNYLNVGANGISWIHLRSLFGIPNLKTFILTGNQVTDAGMVGRAIKDITGLEILKLDHNRISILGEASFVDLPMLKELNLNDNAITEIHHGAFHRTPNLKLVHLENNFLKRVHPESFLQASGSGVEILHLQHNDVGRIEELRSLLDALPMLKFLDLSYNKLEEIPFGALRGHGTLEQLYLDHNIIRMIDRDAFMAMPGLRELRLRNNSISDLLTQPFWNLPGLKGLDISMNKIRRLDVPMLIGLPSLRRIDLSSNAMSYIDPSSFIKTPMLETINLSNNELNQIHPATFRNMDGLFEIDASYNFLPEMIEGLPRAVERVIIQNNQISNISPSKSLELPNLRLFDMSGNILQRIPRSTFQALSQLRVLSLARNKLQNIDEGSLHGLDRLEILDLQDNKMGALHERSFGTLNQLKDLNLQGNRLQLLGDRLLENLQQLERLDVSRNSLVEIFPNTLRKTRSLQILDLSSNNLRELPESILGLSELKQMDVSFNVISNLSPNILATLRNLEELRASNNKINDLQQGLFRNLPVLQYLDLSSNEIKILEQGAVRSLPELQEIVLADNKLVEIPDHVFEDLPNLQAVHLQQNYLRSISPNGFFRSPSVVYLNLSSNQFRAMESAGLRSVRNVEVLDLSNNAIRQVSPNPLRELDWLVELKLDDNRICRIQGEPFSAMPRLRVLSLRNNRMVTLPEMPFRTLRGNIAVLDLDGNPLDCSCDMLWLRAWFESESNNPGPRCRDGTMLREARLSRSECQYDGRNNQIPLTNDHGDLFLRRSFMDECEMDNLAELPNGNGLPPSPEESEYFYDQFVDFPINETHLPISNETSAVNLIPPTRVPFPNSPNIPNNTLLNFNNLANLRPPQPQSPFTFFGVPLPTINLGNLWGGNPAGRDVRNRNGGVIGSRGRGRVQIYRPNDPELQKFLQQTNRYPDIENRHRVGNLQTEGYDFQEFPEHKENPYNRNYFQTPFMKPQIEKGGFVPILPGIGGFTPMINPYQNDTISNVDEKLLRENYTEHENNNHNSNWPDDFRERVPLVTEEPNERYESSSTSNVRTLNTTPTTASTVATSSKNYDHEEKFPEYSNRLDYVTRPLGISTTEDKSVIPIPLTSSTTTTITSTTTTELPPLENIKSTKHKLEEMISSEEAYMPPTQPFEFTKNFHQSSVETMTSGKPYQVPRPLEDSWENPNSPPSSLSALVAPGAQQNVYRHAGRPTITKIASPPPVLPTAEEYLRSTSNFKYNEEESFDDLDDAPINDNFHRNDGTSTVIEKIEPKRKEDMEWYFANYNKTNSMSYDSGINSYSRSSSYKCLTINLTLIKLSIVMVFNQFSFATKINKLSILMLILSV